MLFSHGATLVSMRGITLSSLCLLMHLLQDETTTILVLEKRDLQDSIKPQKVEFHSLNFNSTLHWQPGKAREARDTVYFVQYKVYGQRAWQNKDDCWGIQNHVCDLTNETSAIQEPYYGRVRAASAGIYSDWSLSCRFTPWQESYFRVLEGKRPQAYCRDETTSFDIKQYLAAATAHLALCHLLLLESMGQAAALPPHISGAACTATIGPPTVIVVHSKKSIILKLQAPRSPFKRKKGSKIPMTNYYDLLYQIFIINNLLDEQHRVLVYEGKDKVIKIENLRPGVSYCIMAKTYVPVLDHSSDYSSRQCTVLE